MILHNFEACPQNWVKSHNKYVFGQTNTVCPKDYSLDVNIVCTKDYYKAG